MSAEEGAGGGRKRQADRQITQYDNLDDDDDKVDEDTGTWEKASSDVIKTRRIVKAKRSGSNLVEEKTPAPTTTTTNGSTSETKGKDTTTTTEQQTTSTTSPSSWPTFTFSASTTSTETKTTNGDSKTESTSPEKKEEKWPAFTFGTPGVINSSSTGKTEKSSPTSSSSSSSSATTTTTTSWPTFSFTGLNSDSAAGGASSSSSTLSAPTFSFTPRPVPSSPASTVGAGGSFKFTGLSAPGDSLTSGGSSTTTASSSSSVTSPISFKVFGTDVEKPKEPVLKSSFQKEGSTVSTGGGGDDEEGGAEQEEENAAPSFSTGPQKTGEEDEDTLFNERCKLYEFDDKERKWVEKGVGKIKLNKHKTDRTRSRLVMRTDPALRLILNAALFKGMSAVRDKPNLLRFTYPLQAGLDLAGEKLPPTDDGTTTTTANTNKDAASEKEKAAPSVILKILMLRFLDNTLAGQLKELIDSCLAEKEKAEAGGGEKKDEKSTAT